jgi:hypothetical protein
VIQLDYLGAGGNEVLIHPDSSPQLIELFEETAAEFALPVNSQADAAIFDGDVVTRRFDWVALGWDDADVPPTDDAFARIDLEKIQPLGGTLSLALTKIVRETDY